MFKSLKKKLNQAIRKVSEDVTDEQAPKEEAPVEDIGETLVLKSKDGDQASMQDARKPEDDVKKSGFSLKDGLSKATRTFTEKKISESELDDALWELELALLENNVASEITEKICKDIKGELVGRSVSRFDVEKTISRIFKENVRDILSRPPVDIGSVISKNKEQGRPTLMIFLGFNGAGKTTNLAKLGHMLKEHGYSCSFAAGDTFRAAAIQQLEQHADNLDIPIIKHDYGADAAAVIFDAMKHAKAKGRDVVLADTAGRTHMNKNLIEELKKITRVNNPDISVFVGEAIAGNDLVEQARVFEQAGIDGIILSKWDVDQKGGAALSLTRAIGKPIMYIGVGQDYDDLKPFDIDEVMDSIL